MFLGQEAAANPFIYSNPFQSRTTRWMTPLVVADY